MLQTPRKLSLAIISVFITLIINAQAVNKTMKRLPGTGQTTSYTNTFGEDADYNFNPPFYRLNGNGTITDTVTELMWQKTDGGEMTIENATIYCDTLTLGGYTDWRLPNCHELFSILNHDKTNPAINTTYFTLTAAEYWWSSQKQVNDATKVWCTNAGGGVGNHPKLETISAGGTKRFHVRAVRDITSPPLLPNHYTNNGDGTTTDLLTNLIWKQSFSADSITWEQALIEAENLNFSGHTDWRLPDIKELQSINDESLINPSVSTVYFNGMKAAFFWSSTTLPNQNSKAWYLDTRYGITTYANKVNKNYALFVRNANATSGIIKNQSTLRTCSIYPNPTQGEIFLESDLIVDAITITNSLGQVIRKIMPDAKKVKVVLNEPGVYCIYFKIGSQINVRKVLVLNTQ